MPPIRLYEGDLHGIVKMLSALGNKVEEYGTIIAMLSRDVQEVQSRIALPWQSRPAQDTCRQHDQVGRPVPLPLVESPTIEEANSVSQSADRAERQHQLDCMGDCVNFNFDTFCSQQPFCSVADY